MGQRRPSWLVASGNLIVVVRVGRVVVHQSVQEQSVLLAKSLHENRIGGFVWDCIYLVQLAHINPNDATTRWHRPIGLVHTLAGSWSPRRLMQLDNCNQWKELSRKRVRNNRRNRCKSGARSKSCHIRHTINYQYYYRRNQSW